ncbi:FAD-binding oxidoreductase [Micromonospora sp. WMMD961]|uniref:FAD-binding oxidoreductase n=1 Tax=Micromonospora sp. WMMD961 TaxID=3016100 RepID=UPI0024168125|nr:FAD-binding oxidoreductase [Micromonospora sp. WMMD961]MDG4782743.1 FAD-binding oxidoreductase [Micromonospora sp. WMMD961]
MIEIVRPGDPGYRDLRDVYTAAGAPAQVLRPGDADEVAEALAQAVAAGGDLAVRSGGHGISSIATNVGGSVIDLGRLASVEPIEDSDGLVRVGPGARWGDVAATLRPHGLVIGSGDSGDVGVGGLATTGGIGLFGRAHGLTIDNLVAADIVTADGRIRTVDAEREPDLFWALRGAGANVGIATSFVFRAHRVPAVVHATLQYRIGRPEAFLRAWGETVEAAPRDISAFLYLMSSDVALATIVYARDEVAAATAAIEPFLRLAPRLGQHATVVPYAAVVGASHAPHRGQQSARTHSGLAVHLDDDVTTALGGLIRSGFGQLLQIRSAGGAINDVAGDATAYAHRHQNFSITAVADGRQGAFDEAWDRVRPALDGLYLSFESTFSPELLVDAFPEPTLRRLREIKQRVDPGNVFHQNFPLCDPLTAR